MSVAASFHRVLDCPLGSNCSDHADTAALTRAYHNGPARIIISGSGEFLAHALIATNKIDTNRVISLTDTLGPEVASCAPAYAVAVLATEGHRPKKERLPPRSEDRVYRRRWPWSLW